MLEFFRSRMFIVNNDRPLLLTATGQVSSEMQEMLGDIKNVFSLNISGIPG